jgi:tryptophan synthase alpha chain
VNKLSAVFNKPGHTALIAYITAGYPSLEATLEVVPMLAECGCDIVELGIPFSDPMADGVTIQNASYRALLNGVTPDICLQTAAFLRRSTDIPLVFMTYYTPVYAYGLDRFCKSCRDAGVDGLIMPDLPPDEGEEIENVCGTLGPDVIYLLAPSSTEERIRLVARRSRGFIYLVSVTGVTGARNTLSIDLETLVRNVRAAASQPLCVGFGISSPEQASRIADVAAGVIIGSRIIQLMEPDDWHATLRDFICSIRSALDRK